MRTRILTIAIAACITLSGCALGPPYAMVRKDAPIFDSAVREPYWVHDDLVLACVRERGLFTQDRKACFRQAKAHICVYLTEPRDRSHDAELTAMCNGWRPASKLITINF